MNYKKTIENCSFSGVKLILCPPYPYLPILHSKKYDIGAQDVSEYEKGSFTGEVSAECLKSLDVKYVIIGHYEREMYFLETIEKQKKKIKNALNQNLKVIIPIGESLMEYQLGKRMEVITNKLEQLLLDIPKNDRAKIMIAYEPIWRVGKNIPIKKKEIFDTIITIKTWLYNHEFPNNPVLFGGGLTIDDMQKLGEIDGFLLGNLSLDVEKMCQILEKFHGSTNIYKT